jgi:sortase A
MGSRASVTAGSARRPRRLVFLANLLLFAGAALLFGPAEHFVTGVRAQAAAPRTPRAPDARNEKGPAPLGEAVGRLEIPRVGLDLAVFEGVSEPVLRKGPGHIPGTACPGLAPEPGNCVIAGHRDSFFRRLARAREGDVVRFRSGAEDRSYRLKNRRIVLPENIEVLASTSQERLTLITCYPFEWTGSAPYRLVWEASPLPLSTASVSRARGEAPQIPGPPAAAR